MEKADCNPPLWWLSFRPQPSSFCLPFTSLVMLVSWELLRGGRGVLCAIGSWRTWAAVNSQAWPFSLQCSWTTCFKLDTFCELLIRESLSCDSVSHSAGFSEGRNGNRTQIYNAVYGNIITFSEDQSNNNNYFVLLQSQNMVYLVSLFAVETKHLGNDHVTLRKQICMKWSARAKMFVNSIDGFVL